MIELVLFGLALGCVIFIFAIMALIVGGRG